MSYRLLKLNINYAGQTKLKHNLLFCWLIIFGKCILDNNYNYHSINLDTEI